MGGGVKRVFPDSKWTHESLLPDLGILRLQGAVGCVAVSTVRSFLAFR